MQIFLPCQRSKFDVILNRLTAEVFNDLVKKKQIESGEVDVERKFDKRPICVFDEV